MSIVFDFLQGVAKAIPTLVTKIVTVLLGIFTVGLFLGYGLAWIGVPIYYLLIPIGAMIIMWHKLDEGFLTMILALVIVLFFSRTIGI